MIIVGLNPRPFDSHGPAALAQGRPSCRPQVLLTLDPQRMPPSNLDNLRPLKPVELELLLALVGGERHGYALTQQIAEQTDGLVRLEPGNLYRVIKRLLGAGLIRETDRPNADAADERRRYYRLTATGARLLDAELARMRAVLGSPAAKQLAHRFRTT
jgi:DNA-binding PadR family transcriptional regulator